SVVQTASITSMSIAMLAILAGGAEPFKALPQHAERLLTQYEPMIERLAGGSWERVFFLGMGPFYGVANEAMLKMKEAALVDCDAFHTLEFRHGPSALVDQKTLIVGLLGPQTARHESRLLAEMHQNGATVISFSENPQTLPDSIQQINLQAGLGPMAQAILYQPLLQLLAIYRAQLRGINPDHPRNLTPFVHIDEDLT
ncbi:MAG: SIS domain-containing protein, partial [Anaerolineales bacterium]